MECAKSFIEKHGKTDKFEKDGSCSIVKGRGRAGAFIDFADCMIAPFEKVKNGNFGEDLCDPLEEVSNCETAHPSCKNEYIGLAHGIANVSLKIVFEKQKITFRFQYVSSGSEGKKLDKCAQDFIKNNTKTLSSGSSEKSETSESETSETTESSKATTGTSGTSPGPSGSLWAEIEKLNQKFLEDLKALLPSAMSSESETSESSEMTSETTTQSPA